MAKNSLTIKRQKQKAAIASMNPALKKEFDAIRKQGEDAKKNEVMGMYDIGVRVSKITAKERTYGEAAIPTLSVALGNQYNQDLLWSLGQLASTYSRSVMEKLITQKTSGGSALSLTHFRRLSSVSNSETRKELQKRAFVEDMTTDELAAAILEASGGKKKSKGGRGISPPKTVEGGLKQISKYPTEVHKRVKIWDTHVFKKAEQLSPEECDASLLKQLREARTQQETQIEDSQHIVSRIDGVIDRVERVLSQKSGSNGAPKKKATKKRLPTEEAEARNRAAGKQPTKKKATKKKAAKKATKKKTAKKKSSMTAAERIEAAKAKKSELPTPA